MTIIVWDGESLAGDSFAGDNTDTYEGACAEKIAISKDGTEYIAAIGGLLDVETYYKWVQDNYEVDKSPPWQLPDVIAKGNSTMLIVTSKGLILYGGYTYPINFGFRPDAFGIASVPCNVLLSLGKSAKECVDISCDVMSNCRRPTAQFNVRDLNPLSEGEWQGRYGAIEPIFPLYNREISQT